MDSSYQHKALGLKLVIAFFFLPDYTLTYQKKKKKVSIQHEF